MYFFIYLIYKSKYSDWVFTIAFEFCYPLNHGKQLCVCLYVGYYKYVLSYNVTSTIIKTSEEFLL